jgi:manganese transport protein
MHPSTGQPVVQKKLLTYGIATFFKKLLAFSGPGYLVAVGYMDPGNWATDIAGGSRFGYALLSIILLSNLMAIVLQYLALKLGIVTRKDLAQACRDYYPKPLACALWILAEVAIIACDLAEVIGSAIALNLLFNIPLLVGVVVTALDVLLLLLLQQRNFGYLETIVIILLAIVAFCFGIEIFLAQPNVLHMLQGLVPPLELLYNPEMLYVAIGIVGATIMPHNLYLHSSVVQSDAYHTDDGTIQEAITFTAFDSTIALCLSFFVNAAILIVAAAVFHTRGLYHIVAIEDAHELLTPLLGNSLASVIFAIALLMAGQNATITGTMAGQIIMEGFINFTLAPWLRRLISRSLTIVPAVVSIMLLGSHGLGKLLLLSQAILSMQLPFAIFPLIQFTSDKRKMGIFANGTVLKTIAYGIGMLITFLNVVLLYQLWSM